jgi:hypothetical protein
MFKTGPIYKSQKLAFLDGFLTALVLAYYTRPLYKSWTNLNSL